MMRLIYVLSALVLLISAPFSPAFSQGSGIDPAALDRLAEDLHQVPLTEDMVSRFVASYTEMKAVSGKFPMTEPSEENNDQSELEAMSPEKRKAMDEVATKHGFKDVEEWIAVASTVAMSYAYLREGKSEKDLQTQIDRAIAQAENNPKFSQEQREKAIAHFREIGEKLAKLQPLPQNTEIVEKMIGKVAPVMKLQ